LYYGNGNKIELFKWSFICKVCFQWYFSFYNTETQKIEAEIMIKALFDSFRHRLEQLDWMDHETKVAAKKKLDNLLTVVGYPNWMADAEKVSNYYRPMKIKPSTYFENAVQAQLFARLVPSILQNKLYSLDRAGKFFGFPWQLNAFHMTDLVQIQINPGIFQRPLFSHHNADAINYGSIGMIIAHEITHGFDSNGY
jgi:predicted metalloendopeptidase